MSRLVKTQTNPVVINATGYGPYYDKRAEEATRKGGKCSKAAKAAAASKRYWVQENTRRAADSYLKHDAKNLFRSQWECSTDKKGLYSRVKWEMDKIINRQQIQLEERKERLRIMLEDEQDKYFTEEKNNVPHPTSKRSEMQQRYHNIMEQKEKQRNEIANAKKEQQFRMNCDELRTKLSQKICHLVADEGRALAQQRNKLLHEQNLADKMYDEAWLKDIEAKDKREQEIESRRKLRDAEYEKYIKDRLSGRSVPDYDVPDKVHDRNLMDENKRLAKLEEEWETMQKKMKQDRVRKDLDDCLKSKMARKAKEIQQDLMLDLYFLEQMISSDVEKKEASEKKAALKREQEGYLEYLRDQIKKEAEFEKELERRFKEENDKMWEKKEAQWEAERRMRETHSKRLIEECKEQIRNNMEKCIQMEKIKKEYDEEIRKQAEIDQKERIAFEEAKRNKRLQNQKELLEQIKQREQNVKDEMKRKQLEMDELKRSREEFERKVDKLLAESKIENIHPARSKPNPCCCPPTG